MEAPVLVVLAAGRGSRFDAGADAGAGQGGRGHKLTQAFGHSTVLGSTLSQALRSRLPLVVVTTEALLGVVTPVVAARDVVVLPPADSQDSDLPLGMGYSIAAGVAARANAGGWLVLPGDMPLVQPETLRAVAAALAHHPVVCAQHLGRRGHPVGFATELYSELVKLRGDEGAKRLTARYPAFGLERPDDGVLADVDTPEDLLRLRARFAQTQAAALGAESA